MTMEWSCNLKRTKVCKESKETDSINKDIEPKLRRGLNYVGDNPVEICEGQLDDEHIKKLSLKHG